jgi:hypothetical protein
MNLFFIITFIVLFVGFCWLLLLGGHKDNYDNDELINWGDFSKPTEKEKSED